MVFSELRVNGDVNEIRDGDVLVVIFLNIAPLILAAPHCHLGIYSITRRFQFLDYLRHPILHLCCHNQKNVDGITLAILAFPE
jgi:hypothetical protein